MATTVPARTIFSTEATGYHDWQSALLGRSHAGCGQPGELVRLVSDFRRQGDDEYPPYNKPFSLRRWLAETGEIDEVLHVLDPDMVYLHRVEADVVRGSPVAERIFFMAPDDPAHREIIGRHCRRNAGAVQPIGVPLLIHRADLASFVDRWCELTAEMRADPATRAAIPWVCEMWACAIAASEAGVRFRLDNYQQFPTEPFSSRPLIHYAYDIEGLTSGYRWSKRGYRAWEPIPPPPADVAETGHVLWHHLRAAIVELGGPAESPAEPVAPVPAPRRAVARPFVRCPGDVCRHGLGGGCAAVRSGHFRYCELTDPGHPDFDPRYLPVARGELNVESSDTPRPSPSALWLAKGCDYAGPTCARGCSGDHRICGAGRGAVTHGDCMRCCAQTESPGGDPGH